MRQNHDKEKLKAEALCDIDAYITELHNSSDEKQRKKAALVSYWLKDYIRLLKKEETFLPQKQLSYNRGSIIKVHLGFRIGSEEGGLHYAVVLDRKPKKSSPVLTIVPLSSKKGNRIIRDNEVDIGNEVFRKIISKYDTLKADTVKRINKLEAGLENEKEYVPEIHTEVRRMNGQIKKLGNLIDEIVRMKQGSIALAGQITTVSKIRIYDPTHSGQLLDGISLEPATLDKIDAKIKELYVKT
ncbi:MAG: type II toxin-antitoxin system PemK/MazF family toxin [Prevotellaceae bacterium]|jgi:mRNA-degrading endonuclease toxin of MazEF toxin-antitoxin module|nr:type II toxin-antitoxin system PemK/MazF family toxin [Prevotellaceae bacterium]